MSPSVLGAAERSSRTRASNTIHTASPWRNTAAPTGAAQGRVRVSFAPSTCEPTLITPDAGTGSGRAGGGGLAGGLGPDGSGRKFR